jgi:outer membrane lipoprotein-sorting protein
MSVMASRPVLRWAVPAGVLVAIVGGGVVTTALTASAGASLPPRSAAQLLVDLQTAKLDGVSGTVVERADLGLPALPGSIGGDGSSQLNSLISGSHTLRVWYSGPDKARVALLGAVGESDIIQNGADTWLWSSADNTATHLKAGDGKGTHPVAPKVTPSGLPSDLPKTPQELADRVLAAVDPTTSVSTDGSATVAGRPAYELVIAPKDTGSLVAQVRIAIDGTAHIPTRAEVFARSEPNRPAVEIAFTQVSFTRPDASVFAFTPPPGAKIDEGGKDAADSKGATGTEPAKPPAGVEPKTAVIGKGWTSVLVVRLPQDAPGTTPKPGDKGSADGAASLESFLKTLPEVHGSWGSGHLVESRLFTALLTDDGRVLVGAVAPDRLTAAAADPAAALK